MAEPDVDETVKPETAAKTAAQDKTKTPAGYTAVVYCHGMGSQRRNEELCRLVDFLDRYANGLPTAQIMEIEAKLEPCNGGKPGDIIGYVGSKWCDLTNGRRSNFREVRFYEIYWAPIMAGQKSARRVLVWIGSQVLRPWKTILTPWRERQRLRRAALAQLFSPDRTPPAGGTDEDFAALLRDYDAYEGLPAQRSHKHGDFKGFLAFIGDLHGPTNGQTEAEATAAAAETQRLLTIARLWRRRYVLIELRNGFLLVTAALGAALIFASALSLVLMAIRWLIDLKIDPTSPLGSILGPLKPDWKTAAPLTISLFTLIGIGRFLTDSMGDVEAWSTYQETDEKHESREKIKAEAVRVLSHVLLDDRCSRVVLVSHSLGTTIAHDSLLNLAQGNRATRTHDAIIGPPDLRKIRHFVTMGSPIDKVEYFFESYSSQSHRYKRVTEELRGDIGTIPFSRNRHPYIHWLNFWDEGDPVSGPLQSPTNATLIENRVDNIHVRNWAFPDPGSSHVTYVENATVVGALFDIIGENMGNYGDLRPAQPHTPLDYDSLSFRDRGQPRGPHRLFLILAIMLPWLALVAALFIRFTTIDRWLALAPATLALVLLLIGYWIGQRLGPANPIATNQ